MADSDDIDEKTIAEDLVVTKYKMAGDIANRVLKEVLDSCIPGASIRNLCIFGDEKIQEYTQNVFKKEKELKKGVAFPTCICVNNVICHFSPLHSEPDQIISDGDLVKVDLGVHIDGFIAVVAHTIVIGTPKVKGRMADVVLAAHYASEVALRYLKAGNMTNMITEAVMKVAEAYKCKPVERMLSHQLNQFVIDGEKTIIQNPNDGNQINHEESEFMTHEVYAMDVIISSGEGSGREIGTRVSIFKKKKDENYQLKLKASRMFYSEVIRKYGEMAFNLRNFDDEKKAKLGVAECVNHNLIAPFPVLYEKSGIFVAHFKFTALLMPSGAHKITGLPFDVNQFDSEFSISDPELKSVLSCSANPKTHKKKKKKVNIFEEVAAADAARASAELCAGEGAKAAAGTEGTQVTTEVLAGIPKAATGTTKSAGGTTKAATKTSKASVKTTKATKK